MRRRLLLERAAWQLSRTQLPVTDISLNANYGSLEAFSRAFRKAFAIPRASTGAWVQRSLIFMRLTEFTTTRVRMTRKEPFDL